MKTTTTAAPDTPEHLAALLEVQSRHAAAEQRLSALDAVIAAKEQEASDAGTKEARLLDERADLLADRAIGTVTQDDISVIDAKIEAERTAIADAKQALEGLTRKRAQAEQQLREIAAEGINVARHFVRTEMEISCEKYVTAALEVEKHFSRMAALERMSQIGGTSRTFGIITQGAQVLLPLINLPACQGKGLTRDYKRVLFETDPFFEGTISHTVEAEREALRQAGVTRYF